ncbi:urea ABC transporter permease subunit UrtC, partial [bacterium]
MMKSLKLLPVHRYIDISILLLLLLFPLFSSPFRTEFMGKVMVYMIFAMSLDLLWGYTGLMNMGHAVLFGLGGYIAGISSSLLKTLPDALPDFMARFNLTEVPLLFVPLTNSVVAFLLALLIPGIVAAILGWFIFSSRINGVFFSLITLALANIFELFIANQQKYTNGTNGIGGLPRKIMFDMPLTSEQLYYVILIITVLVYLTCLWITRSRFGTILQAIRENEGRLTFLGFNPVRYKIAVFAISGILAGLA